MSGDWGVFIVLFFLFQLRGGGGEGVGVVGGISGADVGGGTVPGRYARHDNGPFCTGIGPDGAGESHAPAVR